MPPSTTLVMAATLLERMKIQHPDITVRLTEGLSATLSEWLAADRLDLAVVYEPPNNASLSAQRIGSEELCLVINNDQEVPDPVSIEEMSRLQLIAPFEKRAFVTAWPRCSRKPEWSLSWPMSWMRCRQ